MRLKLLKSLWTLKATFEKTSLIADKAALPTGTANVWPGDLRSLGLVKRRTKRGQYHWRLAERSRMSIKTAGVWK